jgi:hypothetical protein
MTITAVEIRDMLKKCFASGFVPRTYGDSQMKCSVHLLNSKELEQFIYYVQRSFFLQKVTAIERLSGHRQTFPAR